MRLPDFTAAQRRMENALRCEGYKLAALRHRSSGSGAPRRVSHWLTQREVNRLDIK